MTATHHDTAATEHPTGEDSDIIHLTCCREPGPCAALCGWPVTKQVPIDDPGPECIVCCDLADAIPRGICVHGGTCPT